MPKVKKNSAKKNNAHSNTIGKPKKKIALNGVIAIISHKRPEMIQEKTLALLKLHHVDMRKVFVFASPASKESYKPIAEKWNFTLCTGGTINEARNNIIKYVRCYNMQRGSFFFDSFGVLTFVFFFSLLFFSFQFDEGQHVIEMDDDIEDLQVTIKKIKNVSVPCLKTLFNESFSLIGSSGLFGFNSTHNNFYAGNSLDKYGLYALVNTCIGYVNDKRIVLTVTEKEDFERCILMYQNGATILKRSRYGIKTKYWSNKVCFVDVFFVVCDSR